MTTLPCRLDRGEVVGGTGEGGSPSAYYSPRENPEVGGWLPKEFSATRLAALTAEEATLRVPCRWTNYCALSVLWERFGDNPWGNQLLRFGLVSPKRPAFRWLNSEGQVVDGYDMHQLLERAVIIADYMLNELQLKAQDRVVLCYPPGLDFIPAFFACLITGLIAVPVYPPDPTRAQFDCKRFLSICHAASAQHALTNSFYYKASKILPALYRAPAEWRRLRWHNTSAILNKHVGTDINTLLRRVARQPADLAPHRHSTTVPETGVWDPAMAHHVDNDRCGLLKDTAIQYRFPRLRPDYIAFLQFTSGSTGQPKGVMVSVGGLLHNCHLCVSTFGLSSELDVDDPALHSTVDSVPFTEFEPWLWNFREPLHMQTVGHECRVFSWLPVYHDMGLIGFVCTPLLFGGCVYQMSPLDFIKKPWSWLQGMSQSHAMCTAAPNFAYELSVRHMPNDVYETLDLSKIAGMLCGAEPIKRKTIKRFMEKFAPKGLRLSAFKPAFGLAENTLICSGPRAHDDVASYVLVDSDLLREQGLVRAVNLAPMREQIEQLTGIKLPDVISAEDVLPVKHQLMDDVENGIPIHVLESCGASTLFACGEPLPGVSLRIVNPETHCEVDTGTVGEIWLNSESRAMGYYHNDEESHEAFGNSFTGLDGKEYHKYFRTGDAGFCLFNRIFIVGRIKDMIIIRGRNYFPQDIESCIETLPEVRAGCSAAFAIEIDGEERCGVAVEVSKRTVQTKNTIGAKLTSVWRGAQYEDCVILNLVESVRKAVAEGINIDIAAIWVCRAGALPKTSSGKLRRTMIRDQLLAKDSNIVKNVLYTPEFLQDHAGEDSAIRPKTKRAMKDNNSEKVRSITSTPQTPAETEEASSPPSVTTAAQENVSSDEFRYRVERLFQQAWEHHVPQVPWKQELLSTPFLELGLDSLGAVSLMQEMGVKLGTSIDSQMLFIYPTMRQLIDDYLLVERQAKTHAEPILSVLHTRVRAPDALGQFEHTIGYEGYRANLMGRPVARMVLDVTNECVTWLKHHHASSEWNLVQVGVSTAVDWAKSPLVQPPAAHYIVHSVGAAIALAAQHTSPTIILSWFSQSDAESHITKLKDLLTTDIASRALQASCAGVSLGEAVGAVIVQTKQQQSLADIIGVATSEGLTEPCILEAFASAMSMAKMKADEIESLELAAAGDMGADAMEFNAARAKFGRRSFVNPLNISAMSNWVGYVGEALGLLSLIKAVDDMQDKKTLWMLPAAETGLEHLHPDLNTDNFPIVYNGLESVSGAAVVGARGSESYSAVVIRRGRQSGRKVIVNEAQFMVHVSDPEHILPSLAHRKLLAELVGSDELTERSEVDLFMTIKNHEGLAVDIAVDCESIVVRNFWHGVQTDKYTLERSALDTCFAAPLSIVLHDFSTSVQQTDFKVCLLMVGPTPLLKGPTALKWHDERSRHAVPHALADGRLCFAAIPTFAISDVFENVKWLLKLKVTEVPDCVDVYLDHGSAAVHCSATGALCGVVEQGDLHVEANEYHGQLAHPVDAAAMVSELRSLTAHYACAALVDSYVITGHFHRVAKLCGGPRLDEVWQCRRQILEFVAVDAADAVCGVIQISLKPTTAAPQTALQGTSAGKCLIGVAGVSVRLPQGCETLQAMTQFVMEGRISLTKLSQRFGQSIEHDRTVYVEAASLLNDSNIVTFDHDFFKMSRNQATATDPHHCALLEAASEALMDGTGLSPSRLHNKGGLVGVFVGQYAPDWHYMMKPVNIFTTMGSAGALAANRLSYYFGFTGPSIVIDTACSSSLVALHLAVQWLRATPEAEGCLVATSNFCLVPHVFHAGCLTKILSKDGRCKAFDSSADGYGRGEAVVALYLRREMVFDRDTCDHRYYGFVEGTATNHGGAAASLTSPNPREQISCLTAALADARCNPHRDVGLFEAHGTGTSLGDPIEASVIEKVLGGKNRCADLNVTSAKSNFGHTEAAAGLVGVVRAMVALTNSAVPPLAGFKELNPRIDALESIKFPKAAVTGLDLGYACVNSLGLGGTNSDAVISRGTKYHQTSRPSVCLLLTGQGAQYKSMGAQLASDVEFRAHLLEVHKLFSPQLREKLHACWLKHILPSDCLQDFAGDDTAQTSCTLDDLDVSMAALFMLQVAVCKLLSDSVNIQYVLGHSAGEVAAAWMAGYFNLQQACSIIEARCQALTSINCAEELGMTAVFADRDVIEAELVNHDGIDIAAVNGPASTVLSGSAAAINTLIQGIPAASTKLKVRSAFHSRYVAAAAEQMAVSIQSICEAEELVAPTGPLFVSALAGRVVGPEEVRTGAYWAKHARECVEFQKAVETVLTESAIQLPVFLECGPQPILVNLAKRILKHHEVEDAELVSILTPHNTRHEVIYTLNSVARTARTLWDHSGRPLWVMSDVIAPSPQPPTTELPSARVRITRGDVAAAFTAVAAELGFQWESWSTEPLASFEELRVAETQRHVDSLSIIEFCELTSQRLGLSVPVTGFFEHETIGEIVTDVYESQQGREMLSSLPIEVAAATLGTADGGAYVLGVGLQLPNPHGADVINLKEMLALEESPYKSNFDTIPNSRFNPWINYEPYGDQYKPDNHSLAVGLKNYQPFASLLAAPARRYDSRLFKMTDYEASMVDPQHMLLMECALRCVQHAGLDDVKHRTGVYVGACDQDWSLLARTAGITSGERLAAPSADSTENFMTPLSGAAACMACARVSYAFDFAGPSLTVDTGCASSTSAMCVALADLKADRCDAALVGAASLVLTPACAAAFCQMKHLTPDPSLVPFDASAKGTIRGEAAGCVMMVSGRWLAANPGYRSRVLCRIKGSGSLTNSKTGNLSMFHSKTQQRCIQSALAEAGWSSVDFVETHGAGIPVSDGIEVATLKRVFANEPLVLSAAHPRYGHTNGALGIVQILRAIVQLHSRRVFPIPNFTSWNRLCPSGTTYGTSGRELRDLGANRALITSYGMGGTATALCLESDATLPISEAVGTPPFVASGQPTWSGAANRMCLLTAMEAAARAAAPSALTAPSDNWRVGPKTMVVVSAAESEIAAMLLRTATAQPPQGIAAIHLLTCGYDSADSQSKITYLNHGMQLAPAKSHAHLTHCIDVTDSAEKVAATLSDVLDHIMPEIMVVIDADGQPSLLNELVCSTVPAREVLIVQVNHGMDLPGLLPKESLVEHCKQNLRAERLQVLNVGCVVDERRLPPILMILALSVLVDGRVPSGVALDATTVSQVVKRLTCAINSACFEHVQAPEAVPGIVTRFEEDSAIVGTYTSADVAVDLKYVSAAEPVLIDDCPGHPLLAPVLRSLVSGQHSTALLKKRDEHLRLRLPMSGPDITSLMRYLPANVLRSFQEIVAGCVQRCIDSTGDLGVFISRTQDHFGLARLEFPEVINRVLGFYASQLRGQTLSLRGEMMLYMALKQMVATWTAVLAYPGDIGDRTLLLIASKNRTDWRDHHCTRCYGDKETRTHTMFTFEEQIRGLFGPKWMGVDAWRLLTERVVGDSDISHAYPPTPDSVWEDTILMESLGLSESLGMKFGWDITWVGAALHDCNGYQYYRVLIELMVARYRPNAVGVVVGVSPFYMLHRDLIESQIPGCKLVVKEVESPQTSLWTQTARAFQRFTRRNGQPHAENVDAFASLFL